MDYFDHLELRAGLDVLWVTRSVAVPDHVRKLRVRPGDPRMHRILSLRQDPVALRRFCARSLSHLQVGRLTDAQLESAVESELESGRLCALVLTLGDAHTAQAQVESASRVPLPPMKPIIAANPAAQPKAAPGAMGAIKPLVASRVAAPTLATPVPGPGTQRPAAATAVAQPQLPKDPDEALGERFSEVISRAGKRAPDEIKQVLLELTSPASIRMMVYIAAGLGVAMLAGVGEIAIAGLLAWAYFEGGKAAVLGVTDLVTFMMLTYNAKTDRDLDDAADALVSAAKALVTVGMVVLLHRMAARKAGPNKPKPVEKRKAPANPEVRAPRQPEVEVRSEGAAQKPKATPPAKLYDRPSNYRKGVREQVFEAAKGPDGRVRDPGTGAEIKFTDKWDMGHKPGMEFKKHQTDAARRGIDRKQFLDEHNDPSRYRPETPATNRSHKGEDVTGKWIGF